jgi:hypothetical protein
MKLAGSRFTKVSAERNPNFEGKLEVKTDIKIKSLEKIKESKETIKVEYIFEIDYLDLGKVSIEGLLFLTLDAKKVKELIKSQKEDKFNTPEHVTITNIIIQKASIKAFTLEEELGLPIHIKFPKVNIQEKPNN